MTQVLNNVDNSSPKSSSGKVEQAACSELLPTAYTSDSEDSVAPADRGKEAWFFLSACWAVQFLIYGMIFGRTSRRNPGFGVSFGVFKDYYGTHQPFEKSSYIAVIGATMMVRKRFPSFATSFPVS